jgi:hypothetical protein
VLLNCDARRRVGLAAARSFTEWRWIDRPVDVVDRGPARFSLEDRGQHLGLLDRLQTHPCGVS